VTVRDRRGAGLALRSGTDWDDLCPEVWSADSRRTASDGGAWSLDTAHGFERGRVRSVRALGARDVDDSGGRSPFDASALVDTYGFITVANPSRALPMAASDPGRVSSRHVRVSHWFRRHYRRAGRAGLPNGWASDVGHGSAGTPS
jgi:hypothetical protein